MQGTSKTVVFFFALSHSALISSAQTYQWAKSFGGGKNDWGLSVAVDTRGNVLTTGQFGDTVDFDPGPGVYNLISEGSWDACISKLDPSGNFVWAKRLGAPASACNTRGQSITTDINNNIYIAGWSNCTIDLDPGTGTYFSTPGYYDDAFILKLDSNGSFIWAKQINGPGYDNCYSITMDANGYIYATGRFRDVTDFDPGMSIYNLTSNGFDDIFVLKLDSNGNFIWAGNMGGSNSDYGASIKVDIQGNVYTTGRFIDTADFDPGMSVVNLIDTGGSAAFVSKLNSTGNFEWAKSFGGVGGNVGRGIEVDNAGNVYSTGQFNGNIDFDPGVGIYNLSSSGITSIFISKLNSNGLFVWANKFGGTGDNGATSIALDTMNNVYISGAFTGVADFDPGPSVYNLYGSSTDIFIAVYDSGCGLRWARNFSGPYGEGANSLVLDNVGDIYITGSFWLTVDFDYPNGAYLTSLMYLDAFTGKYSPIVNGIAEDNLSKNKMVISPNPSKEKIQIKSPVFGQNVQLKILNLYGQVVYASNLLQPVFTIERSSLNIASGVYFVEVVSDKTIAVDKIVIE